MANSSFMAIQFSNSLLPPSPSSSSSSCKRFAPEPPSFYPKRLKDTSNAAANGNVELGADMVNVEQEKVLRKERKRPVRIQIPKTCMSLEFGEVGKKEGLVEEGFEVEGSGYWLACRKGTRHAMEDGYGVVTNINGDPKQALFGVFDGHGGRAAVDFVCKNLGKNIIAALADLQHEDRALELAVKAGYSATDTEFLNQGERSGACVATVLLKDGVLVAANVGDCRVVVSRNGKADALTSDHRAGREDERIRIENTAGGYVSCNNGVWRVHGSLAVSRAMGDSSLKKWVISEPETSRLHLTPDYEFLIMASDGLWHTVSNQEAVDVVSEHKESIQSCKVLVDLASSRGSRDDITVMVVNLQRFL